MLSTERILSNKSTQNTKEQITFVLQNIIIDNYLFGVATFDKNGHESIVNFPKEIIR